MSDLPVRIDLRADPDADLSDVARHVAWGGLLAYPTETVYGLGGAVTESAVAELRRLKGRTEDKPFIALVRSMEDAAGLEWTDAARELARLFWPGPLTLVLSDPLGIFPGGVRDERSGAVAVRVSPHPLVARLLDAVGGPLTSTSVNVAGASPVASGTDAEAVVRRLGGGRVVVLDVGTLPPSAPSTVLDCTAPEPVVLREGAVPVARLRCAVPEIHGS
jgi:L-threonylcarbamoyladenylate synthase